jgi:hypothetical protein
MSDSYPGAAEAGLPGGRRCAPGPARGARIMRQRLAAALLLPALTVTCVSGCHVIKVNTRPAPHGSASGR